MFNKKVILLISLTLIFILWQTPKVEGDSSLSISFIAPTPDSGATINTNFVTINTSITGTDNTSSFIDWNGSLAAYYDLNENSGSTATDKSTHGNSVILKNGSRWTAGKFGSALQFDGIDDYVDIGLYDTFNPGSGVVTWEAWFKTSSLTDQVIIDFHGGTGYDASGMLQLRENSNGTITASSGIVIGGNYYYANVNSAGNVTDGLWHHGALIWDYPNKKIQLFLDGILQGSNTNANIVQVPSVQVGRKLSIGVSHYGTGDILFFNGSVDEVRIYNRALSAEEIKASYNSKVNGLSAVFTVATDGTYQYYAYTTEITGKTAKTETRTLIINSSLPPARSNSFPSGTLSAGTSQKTISLSTDKISACKYSTAVGTDYESMSNTFLSTNSTFHSTLIAGLANGGSYNYYVKCKDIFGNKNTDDFLISFNIAQNAASSRHPFLYFNKEDLVRLRSLQNSPSHHAAWNAIKAWADAHLNDAPPSGVGYSGWDQPLRVKKYLDNMGFVYAMTNDERYAYAAKNWAVTIASRPDWGTNYFGVSFTGMGISFAYDVLYDYLTALEREIMRNALINRMTPIFSTNPAVAYRDYPNVGNAMAGGFGFAGLVLEGEYAGATNWINFAQNTAQLVIGWGGTDGGWFEGPSYAGSTFDFLISFMDAFKRVKGVSLFNSDFLKQLPYYLIYSSNGTSIFPIEDTEYGPYVFRLTSFLYRLASEYNDGYAQRLGNIGEENLIQAMAWDAGNSAIEMYIWKDPNITPRQFTDLPLVRYFSSIGYIFVHTGWTINDYTFVFKSGTSLGHAHADQNSWSLFGPINTGVISGNSGYIGGTAYDLTRSANCILSDGLGQAQDPGDNATAPFGTKGVIQQVDAQSAYVYMRGDAHASYINYSSSNPLLASGDLTKWLRNVIVMKNPFYFVIFDDVAAPKAEQIDWLFQGNGGSFITNGNAITLNNGVSLNAVLLEPSSFSSQLISDTALTKYPQIRIHPAANTSAVDFLTALFPESAFTTVKIKQSNLLGLKVNTDPTHIDLLLFSTDGNPVDQYIELGSRYQATDGNIYSFQGTQIRAQYSTYKVIRLVKISGTTDTNDPARSSSLPTGSLTAGTTQTTISLSTNESATCKYSTAAGTAYASMTNTFTTTGGSYHLRIATGLTNGSSYTYYVRCIDAAGNANTDDLAISFSVSSPSCVDCGLGIPVINPASPVSSQVFTISCPTNAAGYDCIDAYANGSSNKCTFNNFSGNNAIFNCTGLTTGSYTSRCVSKTGTSRNCCANVKTGPYTITVRVTQPVIPPVSIVDVGDGGSGGGFSGGSTSTPPIIPITTSTSTSIAELQALIQQLVAQVAQLQSQLAIQQGITPQFRLQNPLYLGLRNNDVKQLQIFLTSQGSAIYPEGKITGYYGLLTKKAVIRFQIKYNIITSETSPGAGLVGIKTRAKINEIMGR